MTQLVEIKFGSHLYGTSTPNSDLDLKSVHLPDGESLLLQRVKHVITTKTKLDDRKKNTSEDVDQESFTLQRFLGLAAEGQTVAIDMLFAPKWSFTKPATPLWREIQANRERLLTRSCTRFVGYCRTQANRYGIRGSRVAAARAALNLLTEYESKYGTAAKLGRIAERVGNLTDATEHMDVVSLPTQQGTLIQHWEVCDRKMPFTASIKDARCIMERVVAEYGHRALAAEMNKGVDWKALSHAVRIARQAIELLDTHKVTFPRPEAKHLLAIKTGQLDYKEVAEEIDELLPQVESASLCSSLPEEPDRDWIEALLLRTHKRIVHRFVIRPSV